MNSRRFAVLTVGAVLGLTWAYVARAVTIDFEESGGTAFAVESVEVTTTAPSPGGLPGCSATAPPPCTTAVVSGGPGLRNGMESPAEIDLNLLPGTFTTPPGQMRLTALGYLMDRGGKTISDIVALTITNLVGVQTLSITFTSDSTTSNFLPIPDGFVFNGAVEGMPTTLSHVDISGQFFTGPPDKPFDQRPYALPGVSKIPGGFKITALSDVDQASVPEPSSLVVLGCGLIGLALVARTRRRYHVDG